MPPNRGKLNDLFCLENAINLTYGFCATSFLVKIIIKKTCVSNLMHFQVEMDNFFSKRKHSLAKVLIAK